MAWPADAKQTWGVIEVFQADRIGTSTLEDLDVQSPVRPGNYGCPLAVCPQFVGFPKPVSR